MAFTTQCEKGKRIFEYLKKELCLPDEVVGFDVIFDIDSLVTVTNLTYYPPDDKKFGRRRGDKGVNPIPQPTGHCGHKMT